jgi:hypothetical protein
MKTLGMARDYRPGRPLKPCDVVRGVITGMPFSPLWIDEESILPLGKNKIARHEGRAMRDV